MHLSPEEIAAAEACGVSFLPASDAQVQRLAMQRKVFYRAGAAILATRGDGLFETAGTLQQLIEEGRQQQRDLSQWLEASEPAVVEVPEAAPQPEVDGAVSAVPAALPEPAAAEPTSPPPKRPRQKRRRPDPASPEPDAPAQVAEETAAPVEAEPSQDPEAEAETADSEVARLPPALSRPPGRTAARAPAAALEAPGQDRGKRWLMAGAARRGRAGKHWSTRQR